MSSVDYPKMFQEIDMLYRSSQNFQFPFLDYRLTSYFEYTKSTDFFPMFKTAWHYSNVNMTGHGRLMVISPKLTGQAGHGSPECK